MCLSQLLSLYDSTPVRVSEICKCLWLSLRLTSHEQPRSQNSLVMESANC